LFNILKPENQARIIFGKDKKKSLKI
jgi:hypothetical protein